MSDIREQAIPELLLSTLRAQQRVIEELAVRYEISIPPQRAAERPAINCPDDVFALVGGEMGRLAQEQLRVLLLDTRNTVMAQKVTYVGNVNTSVVRPAEVFRPAILEGAACIIVVHNHPSGDPTPSGADVSITRDLVEAGKLLGIELLDHVVIGNGDFLSMKEKRLGFVGTNN